MHFPKEKNELKKINLIFLILFIKNMLNTYLHLNNCYGSLPILMLFHNFQIKSFFFFYLKNNPISNF